MTNWNLRKQKQEEIYKTIPQEIKDKYEGVSGIYLISINGVPCYVGKSKNVLNRWVNHQINTYTNYQQKDYTEEKYSFFRQCAGLGYKMECQLLEECPIDKLNELEKKYIHQYKAPLNKEYILGGVRCYSLMKEIEGAQPTGC